MFKEQYWSIKVKVETMMKSSTGCKIEADKQGKATEHDKPKGKTLQDICISVMLQCTLDICPKNNGLNT